MVRIRLSEKDGEEDGEEDDEEDEEDDVRTYSGKVKPVSSSPCLCDGNPQCGKP